MRYFALACDYDSTIADHGVVRPSTVAALRRLVDSGRKLVLVTGRELPDLQRVFPQFEIFHRIVAENGALLYNPADRKARPLTDPPSREFINALRQARIEPLSIGASIVSTLQPNGAAVLKVIHDLGLELQVIYNRDAAMILPSGVNKGTGLRAALPELGLSPHNAVAVGDAENDHALLSVCEFRVAVSNAIPMLKERADFVTTEPDGKGVEQLIERMLFDDLASLAPKQPRYPVVLGQTDDGQEISIPSYGPGLLIAGPSASGKSTVVLALVERLVANRFQVCLIDPEGDYVDLEQTVTLGNASRAPEVAEVAAALQKPKTSVSVNLLGLSVTDRPLFLASLIPQIQELRARTGRPHWIIIDEAHHVLPSSGTPAMATIPRDLINLLLITVDLSSVRPTSIENLSGVIAVGDSPGETIREFSEATGRRSPLNVNLVAKSGNVFLWLADKGGDPIEVRVQAAEAEKRRHKRKYAEGRLPADSSFFFKGPEGKMNLRAHNLMMFNQIAEGVDDETWLFHLRQHDYSKWMREAIKDDVLAAEVERIENSRASLASESRKEIIEAVNRRYTSSEAAARV
jgi:hydroxymethylpyrimidine pyrophosphatase-like HAD family hydrolase